MVLPIYIADASALVALFAGDPIMLDIHLQTDEDGAILVLPSLAVLAATVVSQASETAWQSVLYPRGVTTADVRATTAIALGGLVTADAPLDRLQAAQTVWEAEQLGRDAWILTRDPVPYQRHPVRVIDITTI